MLRVITFNLRQGLSRSGGGFALEAAEALVHRRPSLLACQEVLSADGVPAEARLFEQLRGSLAMHGVLALNARTSRGWLGNAVFADRPISSWDNLDVSVGSFERRGILRVRLAGVSVCCLHFGLSWRQRRKQWDKLQAVLPEGGPTVVCGDFNDWPGLLDRRAARVGFENALAATSRRRRRTFPARWPLLPLDRVYYRHLNLIGARVLTGDPWNALSDHRPVEADFNFPSASV